MHYFKNSEVGPVFHFIRFTRTVDGAYTAKHAGRWLFAKREPAPRKRRAPMVRRWALWVDSRLVGYFEGPMAAQRYAAGAFVRSSPLLDHCTAVQYGPKAVASGNVYATRNGPIVPGRCRGYRVFSPSRERRAMRGSLPRGDRCGSLRPVLATAHMFRHTWLVPIRTITLYSRGRRVQLALYGRKWWWRIEDGRQASGSADTLGAARKDCLAALLACSVLPRHTVLGVCSV